MISKLNRLKVERCCVHSENKKERKTRTHGDDKGKGEESGIMDDKVQTLCERSSATECGKDDRRRAHYKTSKVMI